MTYISRLSALEIWFFTNRAGFASCSHGSEEKKHSPFKTCGGYVLDMGVGLLCYSAYPRIILGKAISAYSGLF